MLEDSNAWYYGLGIAKSAEIKSGTIYALLARLEKAGWLESKWEQLAENQRGRPPRRLYRLTGAGEQVAVQHLEQLAPLTRLAEKHRRTMPQRSPAGRPA
jgi:DNA-binding PadR family transcriptional regulator